jgi:hypothetical protein
MMCTLEARSSVMRRPGMVGFTNRILPAEIFDLSRVNFLGSTRFR